MDIEKNVHYQNIPQDLHHQVDALLEALTCLADKPACCIYCQHNTLYRHDPSRHAYRCACCRKVFTTVTRTEFARLTPLEWLPDVAMHRLRGRGYASISDELGLDSRDKAKNRVLAIEALMQKAFPELFVWYSNFIHRDKSERTPEVISQTEQLKLWVHSIVTRQTTNCVHCGCANSHKVGTKYANFRCRHCWRYFSVLKGTGLERLRRDQFWLSMIDMFANGDSNIAIKQKVKIGLGAIARARRRWRDIMERLQLWALDDWLQRV